MKYIISLTNKNLLNIFVYNLESVLIYNFCYLSSNQIIVDILYELIYTCTNDLRAYILMQIEFQSINLI